MKPILRPLAARKRLRPASLTLDELVSQGVDSWLQETNDNDMEALRNALESQLSEAITVSFSRSFPPPRVSPSTHTSLRIRSLRIPCSWVSTTLPASPILPISATLLPSTIIPDALWGTLALAIVNNIHFSVEGDRARSVTLLAAVLDHSETALTTLKAHGKRCQYILFFSARGRDDLPPAYAAELCRCLSEDSLTNILSHLADGFSLEGQPQFLSRLANAIVRGEHSLKVSTFLARCPGVTDDDWDALFLRLSEPEPVMHLLHAFHLRTPVARRAAICAVMRVVATSLDGRRLGALLARVAAANQVYAMATPAAWYRAVAASALLVVASDEAVLQFFATAGQGFLASVALAVKGGPDASLHELLSSKLFLRIERAVGDGSGESCDLARSFDLFLLTGKYARLTESVPPAQRFLSNATFAFLNHLRPVSDRGASTATVRAALGMVLGSPLCAICHSNIRPDIPAFIPLCDRGMHALHAACAHRLFERTRLCPICRSTAI